MPTLVNLAFNVADLVGSDFDSRRTKVWLEANVDTIIDTTGKQIRLGDVKATVGDDGTGSFVGLIATNSTDVNPTGFLYRAQIDYQPRSGGARAVWSSGWFALTASSDLALVTPVANAPATVTEDAVIASRAKDPGSATNAAIDEAVAGDVNDPASQTRGALNATFVTPPSVNAYGALGDGVTDDTAAFVAAAQAAAASNNHHVTARPGLYHCPGMTCDDMLEVYIVGDGVTFTDTTWVAAFSTSEWTGRSVAPSSASGRGRISITLDDANDVHFTGFFPIAKELGFPVATAWPTSNGAETRWMKEAYRHGWEIMAHGTTHELFGSVYTTGAQIDAAAQQMIGKISAITGRSDNIAFVYPEHNRNDLNDQHLSKWFTTGRGIESSTMIHSEGHPWLMSAYAMDSFGYDTTTGALTEDCKAVLRGVAATNGALRIYQHAHLVNVPVRQAAFRNLATYARELGIDIVRPSELHGGNTVARDPYLEKVVDWTVGTPFATSTEQAYKGSNSFKFTPDPAAAKTAAVQPPIISLPPAQGRFRVYRASLRYYAAADVNVSSNWGIAFQFTGRSRKLDTSSNPTGTFYVGKKLPEGGTVIPSATWGRVARLLVLGPEVVAGTLAVQAANISAGASPFYLDEIKMDLLDSVASLTYTVVLNGTTGVKLWTGVPLLASCGIALAPLGAVAGRLHYSIETGTDQLTIHSTDAADTTQSVRVTITPGSSYTDLTSLSATGA